MPNQLVELRRTRPRKSNHRDTLSLDKLTALCKQFGRFNMVPRLQRGFRPSVEFHGYTVSYCIPSNSYVVRGCDRTLELKGSPANVARDIADWLYQGGNSPGQARAQDAGESTVIS